MKIQHACVGCGKKRVVNLINGKPENERCYSCANSGENNPNWQGGVKKSSGYVFIYKPEHPKAVKNYVKRAIIVLEETLGRYLRDGYDAHHKNGIKDDDVPSNLEEKRHDKHASLHDNIRWALVNK